MLNKIGLHLSDSHNTLRFKKDEVLFFITKRLSPQITPNQVTLFRLIIALLWIPLAILYPAWWQVSIFFAVYFMDLLDGAVARYRHKETHLGRYFDHISDRINHIVLYFLVLNLIGNKLRIIKFFILGELLFILLLVLEYFFPKKLKYIRVALQFCIKIALWVALFWEVSYLI